MIQNSSDGYKKNSKKMITRKYNCLGKTYVCDTPKASGIITNKHGSFYSIHLPQNQSRYDGFYTLTYKNKDQTDWEMYKIIDEITFEAPAKELLWENASLKTEHASFCITANNSFIIASPATYCVDLDCRHIYDDSTQGRIFNFEQTRFKNHPALIITYKKYTDDSLRQEMYTKYICIMGYTQIKEIKTWQQKHYAYDTLREKKEVKRFVFRACEISGNMTLHIAQTKEDALRYCYEDNIHREYHLDITQKKNQEFLKHINGFSHTFKDETQHIALGASLLSLRLLVTKCAQHRGIWAGLPWFFHFWTRDELISLGGVISSDELHFAIDIMRKYTDNMDNTGLLPNRMPYADLHSADGTGLYFFRLQQLLTKLRATSSVMQYFSLSRLEQLKQQLSKSLQQYEAHHTKDFLVINKSKETWMDTDINFLGFRAGKRIELQALHIQMHMLLRDLCLLTLDKEYKYHESEIKKIREAIKQTFVKDHICYDGIQEDGTLDTTIRPNVFLAYYFCPDMFAKHIWQKTFDTVLPKLWLEWGGLCTLDKTHKDFCDMYSGEQNQSYHRGDSWYFINNIAALCMYRLHKNHYKEYIQKIMQASTHEILALGTMGCHAELSSAKQQQSYGCMLQAWSCATYIELMYELRL